MDICLRVPSERKFRITYNIKVVLVKSENLKT